MRAPGLDVCPYGFTTGVDFAGPYGPAKSAIGVLADGLGKLLSDAAQEDGALGIGDSYILRLGLGVLT